MARLRLQLHAEGIACGVADVEGAALEPPATSFSSASYEVSAVTAPSPMLLHAKLAALSNQDDAGRLALVVDIHEVQASIEDVRQLHSGKGPAIHFEEFPARTKLSGGLM